MASSWPCTHRDISCAGLRILCLILWADGFLGCAGHAADAEEDRDSAEGRQPAANDADSSASSGEEDEHPVTALPRPLPETDAEADATAPEASTSGRTGEDGSPLALSPELITLALLPRSQWQGLLYLDAIKVGRHHRAP